MARHPKSRRAGASRAEPATPSRREGLAPALLALAAVLVVTLAAFAGCFGHDFVSLDDATYVTQNPLVQSRDYGALASSVVNNSYHPLTMISLAMNASRPLSPRPFLVTNVALHLANTALVFWLAFLLGRRRVLAAAVAALLFGIHPMRVESVAWVSSRKDVLYGFFFLGGLLAYGRYLERRARAWPWLLASFALFVASCLAKGMAVVFPLLLPLLDFWKGRRVVDRGAILEKIPFLAVSLLFGLIALDAEAGRDFHGLLKIVDRQLVATMDTSGFTPLLRLALPAYGFAVYAWRLVAPVGLGAFYPYPTAAEAGNPIYPLSILVLLAAVALAVWSVRRARTLAFGLGWFLIAIFPVLQWVPVGASMLADRMTYIAYAGPFLALGLGADALARRSAAGRIATWCAIAVAAALLGSMTATQTRTWRNSDALWSQVIRNHPTSERPYVSRGNARGEAGDLAGAMDDFRTALRLGARDAGVYDGLGTAYGALGNADSALVMYDRALAADPSLGRTYANRAIIRLRRGEPRPALADLDRAASLLPLLAPSLEFPRGNAYLQLGMLSEAEASYTRAIEAGASTTDALQNRGVCRLRRGDAAGARADFERALRLDPGYAPAREQLRAMGG